MAAAVKILMFVRNMRIQSSKWNRALSGGLYILILVSFVLYTWVVLENARETRTTYALSRNQAIAELSARFIDNQWRNVLTAARLVERQEAFISAVQARDRSRAQRSLHMALGAYPDLSSAAVYLPDGTVLASDPPTKNDAGGRSSEWFRRLTGKRSEYVGQEAANVSAPAPVRGTASAGQVNGLMVVAIRLNKRTQTGGFLVVAVRPEAVTGWLQKFAGMDSVVCLVDSRSNLVAGTKGARPGLLAGASIGLRTALQGQSGELIVSEPHSQNKVLAGYAGVRLPGWAVLFAQGESTALGPTYSLAARFAVLVVPMLVLITIVIGLLNVMYARQEKLATEFAEQNEALQHANQIRSDFLANVSHDLRTPLTSMNIALSGLLDTEAVWDREEARSLMQFVSEEVDLLEAKVRNLLEMSRLDARAQPPRKIPADLTDVVGAAMERLEPMLGSRKLLLDFPEDPLFVNCNPPQIETVLLNLLENAVKYSPPGAPLRLIGERKQDCALFAIEDCGPGIEPGQEARIFEKFYRAPSGGQTHGTGLGLAICKAIVAGHGGAIGVINLADGGARFWFTLPSA